MEHLKRFGIGVVLLTLGYLICWAIFMFAGWFYDHPGYGLGVLIIPLAYGMGWAARVSDKVAKEAERG